MTNLNFFSQDFELIVSECRDAYAQLKANNFIIGRGLKVSISKDNFPDKLKNACFQGLECFLVQQDSIHCLQAIGHLREQAFRRAGGGSCQELDLDGWDRAGFWQLLCIDLQAQEICGAYRLLHGAELYCQLEGQEKDLGSEAVYSSLSASQASPTESKRAGMLEMGSVHSLFHFSPLMLEQILPRSLELGRSFVNETATKAHLALPLLFEVLGQIICQNTDYVLGKVTFYPAALDGPSLYLLQRFLEYYWGLAANPLYWKQEIQHDLAAPRLGLDFRLAPLIQNSLFSIAQMEQLCADLVGQLPDRFSRDALDKFLQFLDEFYQKPVHILSAEQNLGKRAKSAVLRTLTLFLKYVSLLRDDLPGSGMHVLGGAINPHFGNVIEFMILVEVQQFRKENLQRWGYDRSNQKKF